MKKLFKTFLTIVIIFRGFVEGFSMLELHGSFGDEISLEESFAYGVDALISGIMKGQENVG